MSYVVALRLLQVSAGPPTAKLGVAVQGCVHNYRQFLITARQALKLDQIVYYIPLIN